MKFLMDTANTASIIKYADIYPMVGVTTNPSIIAESKCTDFFGKIRELRSIIGPDKQLHVQATALDCDGMIADAKAIMEHADSNIFVKIPANEQGIKAMRKLKEMGIGVTATAICSKIQGFMAITAGADFIAPYFNRMENLGFDARDVVSSMAEMIERTNANTAILAASFHNIGQVCDAFLAGAEYVTLPPELLDSAMEAPNVKATMASFTADWQSAFGNKTIKDLVK